MDYEVERLVFVVRSVADGVDKGFKAAERAASGMADVYAKAEKTERVRKGSTETRQSEQVQKPARKIPLLSKGKLPDLSRAKVAAIVCGGRKSAPGNPRGSSC